MLALTTKTKIDLARKCNITYNNKMLSPEEHKTEFEKITNVCAEGGICMELVQMDPAVFEMVVKKVEVLKQYFI